MKKNIVSQIKTVSVLCFVLFAFMSSAVLAQVPATADWSIQDVTIKITATESGLGANDTKFRLLGAVKDPENNVLDNSTPVRVKCVGTVCNVYALAGTATHQDVVSAINEMADFTAEITSGSSVVLNLPYIELTAAGVVSAQHDNAEDPVGEFGSFLINDYGTSSSSGNYWYRGYIFEVASTTIVTHLVSAVTSDGSATVVLYTAEKIETNINGVTLLGHVTAVGTGSEVITPITSAGGGSSVTLETGQLYLLAQTANSGSHVYVNDLDIDNLETHPRIKAGTWEPKTNNSIRWNGSGDENFIGNQSSHHDYHGAMPRIGFLFESDIEFAEISTLAAGISGNEWTFNGNLINTGGAGNEVSLFIEWHTSPDVGNGTLSPASPATTTANGTSFSHTVTVDPNQAYYYRAIAINERGRSNGDLWRVGDTARGTYAFKVAGGTRELQVTGDETAIGNKIWFDAGASTPSTAWDASNDELTVNYVAEETNLNDIRDLITNNASAGLTAVLIDGASDEVPVVEKTTLDSGEDCNYPTDAGGIASDQTICAGLTPSGLTSTSAASAPTGGTLVYQWQQSTTGSSEGFSNIDGATDATYNPGTLIQTTWFRRLAGVDCLENGIKDWEDAPSSNVVEITVKPILIYRSVDSGNWNELSTWEQAIVENPDESEAAHWAAATSFPGQVAIEGGCGVPLVEVRSNHVVNIDGYEIEFDAVEITGDGKIIVKQSNNGKLTIGEKLKMDASTTIQVE